MNKNRFSQIREGSYRFSKMIIDEKRFSQMIINKNKNKCIQIKKVVTDKNRGIQMRISKCW